MSKKILLWITALLLVAGLAMGSYNEDPPIVVVHWQDITAVDNWNEEEEPYLAEFRTVGWLCLETDSIVVIASTWDEIEETWREFNSFPRGCIISITVVNP
ncbi:MAG: hypothetical protein GY906_12230 [bacterium]|nr:hypothetical protein [bacterium]